MTISNRTLAASTLLLIFAAPVQTVPEVIATDEVRNMGGTIDTPQNNVIPRG